ncbi:MAG TPA: TlpA family protein disulfide reductase, partial [Chryseosolibacter sp.]
MNRFITGALLLLFLTACKPGAEDVVSLRTGVWRAVIEIQDRELPFNFEVIRDNEGGYDLFVINADERLLLDEVALNGDSVNIALHIFDASIKAKISGDSLHGLFIKNYAQDYRVPFEAVYGQEFRFEKGDTSESPVDFHGKYAVTFLHEGDTTEAIALFDQDGDRVTGTFMTATGDYRFLEGTAEGRHLKLSTFDGNHLYL